MGQGDPRYCHAASSGTGRLDAIAVVAIAERHSRKDADYTSWRDLEDYTGAIIRDVQVIGGINGHLQQVAEIRVSREG